MVAFKLIGAAGFFSVFSSALAGNAILQNNCAYPVHVLGGYSGQISTLHPGGKYTEVLKGGVSIKITKDKSKGFGTDITQFEYKVDNTLWYDISFINCNSNRKACPGWAGGVSISATGGTCSTGACAPGAHCPTEAYFVPSDNKATKSCLAGQNKGDITMVLCHAKKAKKSVAGRITFEARDLVERGEEDNEAPTKADEDSEEGEDDEE